MLSTPALDKIQKAPHNILTPLQEVGLLSAAIHVHLSPHNIAVQFPPDGWTLIDQWRQFPVPSGRIQPGDTTSTRLPSPPQSYLSNHGGEYCACGDRCSTWAIHCRPQTNGMPMLEQALCNGCGTCISAYPAKAIDMLSGIQEGSLSS